MVAWYSAIILSVATASKRRCKNKSSNSPCRPPKNTAEAITFVSMTIRTLFASTPHGLYGVRNRIFCHASGLRPYSGTLQKFREFGKRRSFDRLEKNVFLIKKHDELRAFGQIKRKADFLGQDNLPARWHGCEHWHNYFLLIPKSL